MSHIGIFIFLGSFFLLTSCVSVNVGGDKTSKAKDVAYDSPSSPFSSVKMEGADQTWQSDKTGNTISFISECGPSADMSLESIQTDSLSGLAAKEIKSSEEIEYNNRAALKTHARGKTDGVSVEVKLMIFKKNGCTYTLSYSGVSKTFDREMTHFEKFLKEFKAP